MSLEPILGYAKARSAQLACQPQGLPDDGTFPSAKEAALEELRRVIVLCEGLISQEMFVKQRLASAGIALP